MSEDSSEKDDDHATHLKEGIAPITIEEEMRSSYLDLRDERYRSARYT